ncbi:uncharacterized protein K489DRAFT_121610 [Dissoconium aciculare CBS 342.82]|uniref:Uncharacterized protein n=1 Tax=Dissoconium aciculare CBS 342.82 TaxID=1314786 RepID=A0A6J3MI99_9PEZI|nr:uncharacterized protein K489DRAFT_121610 [Dissoconium aciculare CBS 342.82]KAF1826632.1 hypothetical protein K489DRAFT_121610 [Dissoconium aciculare CBS 342.82]
MMDDHTTRVEDIPVGLERQGTIPRPARRKKRIVTVVAVAAVAVAAVAICGSPTPSTVAEMASYCTCRACVYTALQVLLTRPAPPMCFAKVRRRISQPVMTYRTFLSGVFFRLWPQPRPADQDARTASKPMCGRRYVL